MNTWGTVVDQRAKCTTVLPITREVRDGKLWDFVLYPAEETLLMNKKSNDPVKNE